MNALKAYTTIAKAQNVTTNATTWLQCQQALLYIDSRNMFVTSKVFKARFPSL